MSEAASADAESIRSWLTERIAGYTKSDSFTIEPDVPLATYGLDSVTAVTLTVDIEDRYDIALEADTLWNYRTIGELADLITDRVNAVSPPPGTR